MDLVAAHDNRTSLGKEDTNRQYRTTVVHLTTCSHSKMDATTSVVSNTAAYCGRLDTFLLTTVSSLRLCGSSRCRLILSQCDPIWYIDYTAARRIAYSSRLAYVDDILQLALNCFLPKYFGQTQG